MISIDDIYPFTWVPVLVFRFTPDFGFSFFNVDIFAFGTFSETDNDLLKEIRKQIA